VVERAREPQAALGARDAHLRGAAGFVAFAAVAALAFAEGGFEPTAWGWAALGLAWAAAAALLIRRDVGISQLEVVQLVALAAFAGWTVLSVVWSESVPLTLEEAKRPLVYVAGIAAIVLWARRRSTAEISAGVAAAGALVCTWNLASRRWPEALGESSHGFPGDLGAPIGYENAVGTVAALTLLLAAGLALQQRWAVRAPALVATLLAGAALSASQSRGAWAALAAGAAAALVLRLRMPRPGLALALVVAVSAGGIGAAAAAGSDERRAYWSATAVIAAEQPILGSGAGTWERGWLRERDELFAARDAHSLYLETLAELGPLGLALLLAALAPPLVAAVRARSVPLVPAVAGAYVAFLLHAGVDWDWELPAVTLAGFACGVAVLVAAGERRPIAGRVAALAALGALAAFAAYGLAASLALASAREALRTGAWEEAESRARLASRLEPWSAEPWRLRGEAEWGSGAVGAARESLRRAVADDPGDVEAWRSLARVAAGGERRRALERAARLDPLGAPPSEPVG
jgi:O-antigen ligase